MKSVVNHEKYGEITYEESFWTGKRKLFINGQEMRAVNKKTFQFDNSDGKIINLKLFGNTIIGVKAHIDGEVVVLMAPPSWYDWVFMAIICAFGIVWGNVPALVKIIPLVGGAIGGLVCGIAAAAYLCVSRLVKKPIFKILIFILILGMEILINYAIAMIIISIRAA